MTEITKPCPQCGSYHITVEWFDDHDYGYDHREHHYIRYNECGLEATFLGGLLSGIRPPEEIADDIAAKFLDQLVLGGGHVKTVQERDVEFKEKSMSALIRQWNQGRCAIHSSQFMHHYMETHGARW